MKAPGAPLAHTAQFTATDEAAPAREIKEEPWSSLFLLSLHSDRRNETSGYTNFYFHVSVTGTKVIIGENVKMTDKKNVPATKAHRETRCTPLQFMFGHGITVDLYMCQFTFLIQ